MPIVCFRVDIVIFVVFCVFCAQLHNQLVHGDREVKCISFVIDEKAVPTFSILIIIDPHNKFCVNYLD